MVEHVTFNHVVVGSIPTPLTTNISAWLPFQASAIDLLVTLEPGFLGQTDSATRFGQLAREHVVGDAR